MLLQAGGQAEHLRLAVAAEGDDLGHHGAGIGQGARLVKDDGVGLGDGLQIFAALHGGAEVAGLPHGGQDGQGHGQLEGAGEVYHEHGQGPGDVAGEEIDQAAAHQGIGHQLVGQVGGPALGSGLQLFRLLDHGDDLVIAAGAGVLAHQQDALALLHHGAGVDGGAGALGHGDGLAGEGGLVHGDLPLVHHAVQGDHAAGADADAVAGLDLGEGDQDLVPAGGLQPDPVDVQGHAAGQVVHRALVGPLLQQLAQAQQEHDRAGGAEVPADQGDADGQAVQQLHMHLAADEAAQAPQDIGHGGDHRPGGLERGGQEEGAGGFAADQTHQLLLIGPVDGPAALDAGEGLDGLVRVGEAAQGGEQLLPAIAPEGDHGAAGALVDIGLEHMGLGVEPGLE